MKQYNEGVYFERSLLRLHLYRSRDCQLLKKIVPYAVLCRLMMRSSMLSQNHISFVGSVLLTIPTSALLSALYVERSYTPKGIFHQKRIPDVAKPTCAALQRLQQQLQLWLPSREVRARSPRCPRSAQGPMNRGVMAERAALQLQLSISSTEKKQSKDEKLC